MLRINNIKVPLSVSLSDLPEYVKKEIGYSGVWLSFKIIKQAIDARRKSDVHYVYGFDIEVENEQSFLSHCNNKDIFVIQEAEKYTLPQAKSHLRPVIVGSGPAGMLAGIALAEAGLKPIILERGRKVPERQQDVQAFWHGGELNLESNVQFGEGGAGTFSDGKLMSGIKKDKYTAKVLQELVSAGAPEEILYLAKPHVGTDILARVVQNIRHKIESLGGEYRFENKLEDIIIKNQQITALKIRDAQGNIYEQATDSVILAIGHSARDTFEMLYRLGFVIEPKPFAVGVRVEHEQNLINASQYGKFSSNLGAADYKMAYHASNGRSAFTFCMCPGGEVIAAASEKNRVVTNGMSVHARNKENANAALLVGVTPQDFGDSHPLQGMYWQRELEEKAFVAGGRNYHAPAQLVGDFLKNKDSKQAGSVKPSYTPGVTFGNMASVLPPYILETMRLAIVDMDKKLHGFATYDAVMTGVESRSSSPIRIYRDETLQSSIKGLFPCGEGAGYAGGIMSAAVDGLKCAEKLVEMLS